MSGGTAYQAPPSLAVAPRRSTRRSRPRRRPSPTRRCRPAATARPWAGRSCRRCRPGRGRRATGSAAARRRACAAASSKLVLPGSGSTPEPSSTSTRTSVGRVARPRRRAGRTARWYTTARASRSARSAADLGRPVVLVDVERHRPRPVGAEHRLDVLGAVVEHEGDGVLAASPTARARRARGARPSPRAPRKAAERPGAVGDLGEGPAHVAADEHLAVGHRGRRRRRAPPAATTPPLPWRKV